MNLTTPICCTCIMTNLWHGAVFSSIRLEFYRLDSNNTRGNCVVPHLLMLLCRTSSLRGVYAPRECSHYTHQHHSHWPNFDHYHRIITCTGPSPWKTHFSTTLSKLLLPRNHGCLVSSRCLTFGMLDYCMLKYPLKCVTAETPGAHSCGYFNN